MNLFIYYFSTHTIILKRHRINPQKCPEQDLNCLPLEWQAEMNTTRPCHSPNYTKMFDFEIDTIVAQSWNMVTNLHFCKKLRGG